MYVYIYIYTYVYVDGPTIHKITVAHIVKFR